MPLGIVSSCFLRHESQRSSRLTIDWDMSFAARELLEGCGAGDPDADCDCCDSDSDSDVTDNTSIWLDEDELDSSLLDFGEFFGSWNRLYCICALRASSQSRWIGNARIRRCHPAQIRSLEASFELPISFMIRSCQPFLDYAANPHPLLTRVMHRFFCSRRTDRPTY